MFQRVCLSRSTHYPLATTSSSRIFRNRVKFKELQVIPTEAMTEPTVGGQRIYILFLIHNDTTSIAPPFCSMYKMYRA